MRRSVRAPSHPPTATSPTPPVTISRLAIWLRFRRSSNTKNAFHPDKGGELRRERGGDRHLVPSAHGVNPQDLGGADHSETGTGARPAYVAPVRCGC
jgi:hypothetical protein